MTAFAPLRIVPGLTFRRRITWLASGSPVDTMGISADFTAYDRFGTAVISLDETSGITLGGAAGTLDLYASAAATTALDGTGTWRIRITDTIGDTRDLVAGIADYRDDTIGPTLADGDIIIDERPGDTLILESAGQGPAGPVGPSGATTISLIANGAIGGHRLIAGDDMGRAEYGDRTDPTQIGRIVGMSLSAAADGQPVPIAIGGEISEPSWAWMPGPLWLGTAGIPTQIPPSSGILQYIGSAITSTKIILRIELPIYLG